MNLPGRELRLLSAGLSFGAEQSRLLRDASERDWRAAIRLANGELVSPALYSSLKTGGLLDVLPDDARDSLATIHRLNGSRNRAILAQLQELIVALNRRGIEPMLLKGATTLHSDLYGDLAARMIGDIDILVPERRLRASLVALSEAGYEEFEIYGAGNSAYGKFVRDDVQGAVDLRLAPVEAQHLLPAPEMWHRASLYERDGIRFALPSPTDRLLHNILDARIHHLGGFDRAMICIRQLLDAACMTRVHARDIDWTFIEVRLGAHGLETALYSYFEAARNLLGVRWPWHGTPTARSRFRYRRWLVQRRVGMLTHTGVAWGELRRLLFAGQLTRDLYGQAGEAWSARRMLRMLTFRAP